ncbi:hypothetical protein BS17DRAFT_819667 [Gyrodon lividus]|nr:hypothetical protein BS17DRAFT_819667 [Gyrodon lividus]
MDNYYEFLLELQTNFGPHDPITDAEHQLDNLSMKDGQHINKYIVELNCIMSQVRGYREGTLCHCFYSGLPDHLKDKVSHVGKPTMLTELHVLSQGIDAHYWECKSEVNLQAKPANPPPAKTHTLSFAKSMPNPANSTSASNSDSKAKASPPHPPQTDLLQKLGKGGKLTSKERKCCFDLKLCMFCGASGHMAKDCHKSTSKAAKACTATTSALPDATLTASASKAKKIVCTGWGCVDSDHAPKEMKLNVSALSNPNALTPPVTILSHNIPALPDFSSSDCFYQYYLCYANQVKTYSVSTILLQLFDGTLNCYITKAIDLSIPFSTGDITSTTFYVTLLDSACSLVLGHNWLTHYNLLIDWVLGSIEFRSIQQQVPMPLTSSLQPLESPL